MKALSKTYEQFCCVLNKNVTVEEITAPDGSTLLRCTMRPECVECRNKILKNRFDEGKTHRR